MRRQNIPLAVFCALFAGTGIWLAWVPSSLDILHADDYNWYKVLDLMHSAVIGTAPRSLVVSNTIYGWPFWLLTYLPTTFFRYESSVRMDAAILISARAVEVFFAAANVTLLFALLRKELQKRSVESSWLWSAVGLITLMPAWWEMTTLIHPQQMVLFAHLISISCLIKDSGKIGRTYWIAVAALGVAVALKLESLMMAPIFATYLIAVLRWSKINARQFIRTVGLSAVIVACVWLVLNPYLLSSRGLNAWLESIFAAIDTIRADSRHDPYQGLATLTTNYLSFPIILSFVAVIGYDSWRSVQKRALSLSLIVLPFVLLSLTFCIFFVDRRQPQQWLTVMVFLQFALVPLLVWTQHQQFLRAVIIIALLTVQTLTTGQLVFERFDRRAASLIYSPTLEQWKTARELHLFATDQAKALAPLLIAAKRPIASPYTDLNYRSLGVPFVSRISDCLSFSDLRPTGNRIREPAVDLIIFRKNDPSLRECPETRDLVARWSKGNGADYHLVGETEYLLAFGLSKH